MKTPRELLLLRHKASVPKLHRIRHNVIETAVRGTASAQAEIDARADARPLAWICEFILRSWAELIVPSRRIWAGLAAVWLALIVINAAERATQPVTAGGGLSPGALQALTEQNRLLAELLQTSSPPTTDRPKPLPRPRTQAPAQTKAC